MSFVIFDTEYTSWKGCQENGWIGNQKKEIVQISALKVSDTLDVIAQFTSLCKPVINPVLSDYFTNLTRITNAQIEKQGKSFKDVFNDFIAFVGNNICYSHGWGADYFDQADGKIIKENINLYGLFEQKELIYRNIAPIFKQLYLENNIFVKSQSSGQIVEILNLKKQLEKLGLNPHNSLYDVYSILEGLKYFYPESVELLNIFEN
ncbi:MAG: exonuclease domain-containing protein [Alphaproteobacteria bacterium]|nr:exonuclease domain-containing protein [Alphaproteobacteria bacterium]